MRTSLDDSAAKPLEVAACLVLALWMLWYWYQTAYFLWAHYTGFPIQDYWRTVAALPQYERWQWGVLWAQHNEHRLVLPDILYAIDDRLLHAHEYLPIALSVISQFSTAALFGWVVWRDSTLPAPPRIAALLLCGILMGWPGISYVLSWPFLIQWTLAQVLVAGALVLMTRGHLATPLICMVLATFTSGHGMLGWPAILLAALALRIGWRRVGVIALTATLSIAAYFYRLVPSVDAQTRLFKREPAWFIGFLSSMIGMPFDADRRVLGLVLGPIGFALFVTVLLIAWRRKLLSQPPAVVLFGYLVFSLLTILVCGMGRTLPTFWQYPTAKVARYLSVPVSYWTALILVTIWTLLRGRFGIRLGWTAIAVASCGVAYQLPRVNPWLAKQFDYYSRAESGMLSLQTGVKCDSLIATDIYPVPEDVWKWNPIIKSRKLSVYENGHFEWMGKPIGNLFNRVAGASIGGTVTSVLPFSCALQLAGWVDGGERDFVLVNDKGNVAGLARRMRAALPLYLPNRWIPTAPPENWTGFVDYALAGASVQPYAILADGSPAPFGTTVPIPPPDQRTW